MTIEKLYEKSYRPCFRCKCLRPASHLRALLIESEPHVTRVLDMVCVESSFCDQAIADRLNPQAEVADVR